jgi:hypothetical protein
MPAKDRKPKWKPARERINPVAITLRFDDDDGDDAGAAFAFGDYLQHYRKGEMAEALERLAELHRLVRIIAHDPRGRGQPLCRSDLGADRSGDRNDRTSCLAEVAVCPWHAGPDRHDQAPGQAGARPRSASDPESVVDQPRAPDFNLVLSAAYLLCSVNDAVNVLPCSTWSYLNGRLS